MVFAYANLILYQYAQFNYRAFLAINLCKMFLRNVPINETLGKAEKYGKFVAPV